MTWLDPGRTSFLPILIAGRLARGLSLPGWGRAIRIGDRSGKSGSMLLAPDLLERGGSHARFRVRGPRPCGGMEWGERREHRAPAPLRHLGLDRLPRWIAEEL